MTKRTKVAEKTEAVPASLASEVYDCLLESSRKELMTLLAVLVKNSSKTALEAVRTEAIKRGVLVLPKQSKFQQCNHTMLDSFFSFLSRLDLRAAQTVCRRWLSASVYSNAGWFSALSRGPFDAEWHHELTFRRISPSRLPTQTGFMLRPTWERMRTVGKLPSLTKLHLGIGVRGGHLEPLQKLQLQSLTIKEVTFGTAGFDITALLSLSSSLTELKLQRVHVSVSAAQTLMELPQLRALSLWVRGETKSSESKGSPTAASTSQPKSAQNLTFLRLFAVPDAEFYDVPSVSEEELALLLNPARIPALTTLKLGAWSVSEVTLQTIAKVPSVTAVDLLSAQLENLTSLQPLSALSLRTLKLDDSIEAAVLGTLPSTVPELEFSVLEGADDDPPPYQELLSPLQKLTAVRRLTLSTIVEVVPTFFEHLFANLPPSVTNLKLENRNVFELDCLDELSRLPPIATSVTELSIEYWPSRGASFNEASERVRKLQFPFKFSMTECQPRRDQCD